MEYSFRDCKLEDFEFLFELKKQNFKWYVEKIWGWDDDVQREWLKRDLDKTIKHKKIIVVEGKDIGVYSTTITENNDFLIEEISLIKEFHNKGIGTNILNEQLSINNIKKIRTILQVFKDNLAKNLYERIGFSIYNETETHYQMEKIAKKGMD